MSAYGRRRRRLKEHDAGRTAEQRRFRAPQSKLAERAWRARVNERIARDVAWVERYVAEARS